MARGSEIKVAITSDNSGLKRGLDSSEGQLKSFGRKTAKYAAIAGAAAAVGLAKLSQASIKAASDAQQSLGGTEAVFGKFSKQVIDSSTEAADAVGLSANKYRESANIIGSLLKNQGLAARKLAPETDKLIKTGADLAAVYGGTVKDAVDAMASAYKGEFDPLQNYGVTIKQSMINTEALAVANVKTTAAFNKLSSAQKIAAQRQATTNLLMRQSRVTNGQYQQQLGTLAEQQQRLGAKWDDLKVKIGNALLPAMTAFVKVVNDRLMPALSGLADKYLPKISAATTSWLKSLDGKNMTSFGDSLKSVQWGTVSKAASDLSDTLRKLGPAFKSLSLDTINNSITVFGTVIGFAADHVDVLAKVLPILLASFAAYKAAQLVNNTIGKDSLIGFGLQIAATRQLTVANRELAVAVREVNIAQGANVSGISKAASGVSRLGTVARGAAGLAGIGGLAAASSTSNKALSTLGQTASGALLGFSVGGPIGAAVGGVAGLLLGLATNVTKAGDAAETSRVKWSGLKDTLDTVTGATTDATKAFVYDKLERSGALKQLEREGISRRTAVAAVTGEASARKQVSAVLAQQQGEYDKTIAKLQQLKAQRESAASVGSAGYGTGSSARKSELDEQIKSTQAAADAQKNLIQNIKGGIGTLSADVSAMQQRAAATRNYAGLLRGLPRNLQTNIRAEGIVPTIAAITNLAKKYRLAPKQVNTVIKASGVKASVADIRKINAAVKDASKAKFDGKNLSGGVKKAAGAAKGEASKGGKGASTSFATAFTSAMKINGGAVKRKVSSAASGAKGTARSGGSGVGKSLGDGVVSGINSRSGAVSAAGRGMINSALASMRAAAQTRSPSRKTRRIGRDMGRGLAQGIYVTSPLVVRASRKLINDSVGAMTRGLEGVNVGIDRINSAIRKRIGGKNQERRENTIIRRYAKTYAALRKNGQAQDANNKKLDDAISKYKDLIQQQKDYVEGIKDSVVAYGSVISVGQDAGFSSFDQMVEQMQARNKAAQDYATILQSLAKSGLNKTTLQQLIDAGVEGGLGTAQTIQAAGAAGIKQLNDLTAQLTSTGSSLGTAMGKTMYDAGIKAAKGLVDGLKREQAQLDRAATRMAQALARAVKRALKIRSPSRVFADIGSQTVKGLSIGLDDVYVSKQGAQLASSLTRGFGQPDLTAAVATGPYGDTRSMTATVTLNAQQLSQLERGRSIQLDLDAYRGAGGRARA